MKDEQEWKNKLSDDEYRVLRMKGTEAPWSGAYVDHKEKGVYTCKACGNILFKSEHKASSHDGSPGLRGWPSFTEPGVEENIGTRPDDSLGMHRTEVYCKKCNSHLGHLFDDVIDGKEQKHYCINSVCLGFEKSEE